MCKFDYNWTSKWRGDLNRNYVHSKKGRDIFKFDGVRWGIQKHYVSLKFVKLLIEQKLNLVIILGMKGYVFEFGTELFQFPDNIFIYGTY